MILFPAIDIKDGKCVRLLQGDMQRATVFADIPAQQAKSFAAEGAEWIHIVDLNGAFSGKPVNSEAVISIIKSVNVKLQLGGGIRDIDTIEYWLKAGISRVVLGTAALKNPELVKEACRKYPGKIVVGIDAKDGMVAVNGWAEESDMKVEDLLAKFKDAGVAAVIYTDISKDGMMQGPNIEGIKKITATTRIPIIASGGISSHQDLEELKKVEDLGVIGVICGRAIYDGKVNIKEARQILE